MGITVHGNVPAALREVTSAEVGIAAVAGNITANGNWVHCAGFNQATVLVSITNSGAVGSQTPFTFGIDASNDASAAYPLQTASTSSGTATLSKLTYSTATGDASISFAVDFPINYRYFRINTPTLTNGDAGDSYSIEVNLGNI